MNSTGIQESDETYLLAGARNGVKVRDDLMDVKILREISSEGLERWEPVLKASFPMSADDVRAKFRENATLALDDRALQALEDAVLTLDDQADLAKALAPLSLAQLAGVRVAAARPGR